MGGLSQWLFVLTVLLYLAGVVAYFVFFYFRQWERVSTWLARGAWAVHSLALLGRVLEVQHPPLFTGYESILFMTWVIFLNYLMLEYLFNLKVVGVFILPVLFTFLVYAAALPKGAAEPSGGPAAGLWVAVHALIALGGYAIFALAFVAALMYLLQERHLRRKDFDVVYQRLPSLETLDSLTYRLVIYGFPLLSMAIVTAAIWARTVWGVPWFQEPKAIWTLFIWAVYAAYIVARVRGGWRGRKSAYLVVAGFLAVLFNLFIVNLLLTERHLF